MSLNITILDPIPLQNGAMRQAATLRTKEAMAQASACQTVAIGAQSAAIAGGVLVRLAPDEDQRIELTATVTFAAPSADATKLWGGAAEFFYLPPGGPYYFNVVSG